MSQGDNIEYISQIALVYPSCSMVRLLQEQLTQRALELLALPDDGPKILLDLGCGSGLSGEELTENGYTWIVSTLHPLLSSKMSIRHIPLRSQGN